MSVSNLYIEYELVDDDDHNMVCLYAKDACNCTICSGLYIDSDSAISVKAVYYAADDFL